MLWLRVGALHFSLLSRFDFCQQHKYEIFPGTGLPNGNAVRITVNIQIVWFWFADTDTRPLQYTAYVELTKNCFNFKVKTSAVDQQLLHASPAQFV